MSRHPDSQKKKSLPQEASQKNTKRVHGNSADDQRQRLLAHLREHGSIDTLTARKRLDILMPAARIFELRAMGFVLPLVWVRRHTEAGRSHRVGKYLWTGDAKRTEASQ